MTQKHLTAKYACYMSNASMSAVATLSPLLFITFHQLYGISYTRLGLLVLVNFCTQLCVDLLFSFYAHKFNIQKTVRAMPLLTVIGLMVYAIFPALAPERAYLFLVTGTIIFSASAGLGEVLISPVIAALPSKNPERDMSRAHSVYAWGVAVVVLLSTLYLQIFGRENWYILTLLWVSLPLTAFVLFLCSEIPPLETTKSGASNKSQFKNPLLFLCVTCIFLGGASENTMTQWCSGYLEAALGISKIWGDVFGVARVCGDAGAWKNPLRKIWQAYLPLYAAGIYGLLSLLSHCRAFAKRHCGTDSLRVYGILRIHALAGYSDLYSRGDPSHQRGSLRLVGGGRRPWRLHCAAACGKHYRRRCKKPKLCCREFRLIA